MPRALLHLFFTLCALQLWGCSVFGPPARLDFSPDRLSAPLARADGSTTTLSDLLDARVTLLLFTDETRRSVGGPREGLEAARAIATERDDVKVIEFVRARGTTDRGDGTPVWTRIVSPTPMPAHRAGLSHEGDRPTYLANDAGVVTLIEPDIRGRLALFEDAALGLPTAPVLVGLSEAEAIERFGPPRIRRSDGTWVYDYRNPPHTGRTRATVRDGVIVDTATTRAHEAPTSVAFVVPRRRVALTARELLDARAIERVDPEAPAEIMSLTLERIDSGRSVTIRDGSSARLEPGDYRLSVFVRTKDTRAGTVRDLGVRTLRPGDRITVDAFQELRLDPDPPKPKRPKPENQPLPTWEPSPLPFRTAHHPF